MNLEDIPTPGEIETRLSVLTEEILRLGTIDDVLQPIVAALNAIVYMWQSLEVPVRELSEEEFAAVQIVLGRRGWLIVERSSHAMLIVKDPNWNDEAEVCPIGEDG